jgi:hypothetical protein
MYAGRVGTWGISEETVDRDFTEEADQDIQREEGCTGVTRIMLGSHSTHWPKGAKLMMATWTEWHCI